MRHKAGNGVTNREMGNTMKTVSAIALVALIVCAEQGTAQDRSPSITGDSAAVVFAALEWSVTAEKVADGRQIKTFVVSSTTNGWRSLPPGAPRLTAQPRSASRELELLSGVIQRLEAGSGMNVETCDEFDRTTQSLCGISRPWIWVLYDLPSIEGDSARITVSHRWLEFGNQQGGRGEQHLADFDLLLTRERGAWTVTASRPSGVS
jgi:hypothetical protein